MRAVLKTATAQEATSVAMVADPEPGPTDVVMKVEACGLCGSDLHAWRSDPGYEWVAIPLVMGHEFVGTITSVGSAVTQWNVGDRAVVVSIQGCLDCDACRAGLTNRCPTRQVIGLNYDGAMAEYVRVPQAYLLPFSPKLPARLGATVEPLSVAAHAVLTVGEVQAGQKVVVSGAGFIGIASALIAQDAGAEVILLGAPQDAVSRIPAAVRLGIDARDVTAADWGTPDVWVEASGAQPALAAAVETTAIGGRISVVGMFTQQPTMKTSLLVRRELTMKGVYASIAPEYVTVIDLLESGRIDPSSLVDEFALDDAVRAFEAAAQAQTLKPVIVPA